MRHIDQCESATRSCGHTEEQADFRYDLDCGLGVSEDYWPVSVTLCFDQSVENLSKRARALPWDESNMSDPTWRACNGM